MTVVADIVRLSQLKKRTFLLYLPSLASRTVLIHNVNMQISEDIIKVTGDRRTDLFSTMNL